MTQCQGKSLQIYARLLYLMRCHLLFKYKINLTSSVGVVRGKTHKHTHKYAFLYANDIVYNRFAFYLTKPKTSVYIFERQIRQRLQDDVLTFII